MKVFIYKITSPNNKSYIGQVIEKKGIQARWKQHVNCSKLNKEKGSRLLNSAIIKYGEENFKIEKVCCVNNKIKDVTEQFCIAFYKTLAPNGYNLQSGGTFTEHSEETKKKRSESLKLLLQDPNKKKVWSNVKKGVPQDNKKNRKYEEDYNLPKYIRKLRGKYEGYAIDSHPLCKSKKFQSVKFTMEEKYNLANDYLCKLNDMVAVQRLNGNG
jgi:hypothetical protein